MFADERLRVAEAIADDFSPEALFKLLNHFKGKRRLERRGLARLDHAAGFPIADDRVGPLRHETDLPERAVRLRHGPHAGDRRQMAEAQRLQIRQTQPADGFRHMHDGIGIGIAIVRRIG